MEAFKPPNGCTQTSYPTLSRRFIDLSVAVLAAIPKSLSTISENFFTFFQRHLSVSLLRTRLYDDPELDVKAAADGLGALKFREAYPDLA